MILRKNFVENIPDKSTLEKVTSFAEKNNLDLLFATFFGSRLYGTNTPTSDTDIKGIFLPRQKDLLLEQAPACFTYNTGNNFTKNSAEDQDIEFYSLQNFLRMVARGDTGALDLLFAHTNSSAVVYMSNDWSTKIIENYQKLFNPLNTRAFMGYAIGQATKYSLKGDRLEILEYLIAFCKKYDGNDRLENHIDEILSNCNKSSFVKEDFVAVRAGEEQNIRGIRVLGKMNMGTVLIGEFIERLKLAASRYGNRAKAAKESGGVDWKAVSHAIRVTKEAYTLITKGRLNFPLSYADEIKEIKAGNIEFDKVSDILSEQIDKVDNLLQHPEQCVENKFDKSVQEQLILSFYR